MVFEALPLGVRLGWIFVVGLCLGSFLNVCIYRIPLGAHIGGSSQCPHCGHALSWLDKLPLLSQIWLRGKCRYCQARFSWGYFFIELVTGLSLAGLYYWEIGLDANYPILPVDPRVALADGLPEFRTMQYQQYFAHAILFLAMLAASAIDFRHFTIPDEITIPTVLIGLVWSAAFPGSLLPDFEHPFNGPVQLLGPLLLTSHPAHWVPWLDNAPANFSALGLALGCFVGWALALLPWAWRTNWGYRWAFRILVRRLTLPENYVIYIMIGLGAVAIVALWLTVPVLHWRSFLTSLVGLAASGAMVWAVRIIAGWAMGREAMGFGDVTLMAMIGVYLGWQPCLMIFFLAPIFGLLVALGTLVLFRGSHIPYGPYLCLGASAIVVGWVQAWTSFRLLFVMMGAYLPPLLAACLLILGALLLISRGIKSLLGIEIVD